MRRAHRACASPNTAKAMARAVPRSPSGLHRVTQRKLVLSEKQTSEASKKLGVFVSTWKTAASSPWKTAGIGPTGSLMDFAIGQTHRGLHCCCKLFAE